MPQTYRFTLMLLLAALLGACASPAALPSLPPRSGPPPEPLSAPFPQLNLPIDDRGRALGLPAWPEVQKAIAEELISAFDRGSYQCEWDFLGKEDQRIFIRYGCEYNGGNGARAPGPAIIYLKTEGQIEKVFIPKFTGSEWDTNPDVPASIHTEYRRHQSDLMSRLILRRAHPELPPAVAVKEGFEPVRPLSLPSVFTGENQPRWRAYERAFASEWYGTDQDILCEWTLLGALDGKIYAAPNCQPVEISKRVFRIPYCILTPLDDKELQAACYEAIDLGSAYGLDPKVFPPQIAEKYLEVSTQNTMPVLDHLELRRWYRHLPPLAAEEALP